LGVLAFSNTLLERNREGIEDNEKHLHHGEIVPKAQARRREVQVQSKADKVKADDADQDGEADQAADHKDGGGFQDLISLVAVGLLRKGRADSLEEDVDLKAEDNEEDNNADQKGNQKNEHDP